MKDMIPELPDPFWVGHKDHNPRNCQRDNLLVGTPSDVMMLRTSGFRPSGCPPEGQDWLLGCP